NFAILPPVDFRTFIDPSLLPEGGERAWGIKRAQREGRGHARETRVDQEIRSQQLFLRLNKSRKTVFDVTASGANGRSTCKMNLPIVNPSLIVPKTDTADKKEHDDSDTTCETTLSFEKAEQELAQPKNISIRVKFRICHSDPGFGVLEGADDDGDTYFACRPLVGSRRRHVENNPLPREAREHGKSREREGRGHGGETRVDQRKEVNMGKNQKEKRIIDNSVLVFASMMAIAFCTTIIMGIYIIVQRCGGYSRREEDHVERYP
ncbi:hypothetical protein PRIPAC_85228, partial [Pristionchus pacificus]|uniref:Uncharacterized protein n=1 Tax=Pristionchus pacificus TaxID=54126 RepID=A0A2A6BTN4_PRIPA